MATVLDIANNQIKSFMPVPQTPQPKAAVKKDINKVTGFQDAAQVSANAGAKEDEEEVARIAEDIKSVVESLNVSVSFSIEKRDSRPDIVIAKVIDKDTGDVIRQIPSEEIIELGKRLDEFVGIIFNKKT